MVSLAGRDGSGQQGATLMHHSSPEPRHHFIDSSSPFDMLYRHYANPHRQHSHQPHPQPQQQSANASVAYIKQWAQQRVPAAGANEGESGEDGASKAGDVEEKKSKKKKSTTQDSPEWLSSSDEGEDGGGSSETSQTSSKRKRQRRDVPSSDLYGPSNIRTRKTWEERFEDLKRYKRQHGHLAIPYTGTIALSLSLSPSGRRWVDEMLMVIHTAPHCNRERYPQAALRMDVLPAQESPQPRPETGKTHARTDARTQHTYISSV
jgi:hypothetical protein